MISQHLNKSYAPFPCKSAQNELDFYEKLLNKERNINQNIFLFHKQSLLRIITNVNYYKKIPFGSKTSNLYKYVDYYAYRYFLI